ncbi:MAG: D-amino acid aminotransferase [Flavobacteriaceae bacterium]|nr:D-amino acid aminotransferase [Flavobacteriaceae bacterium]
MVDHQRIVFLNGKFAPEAEASLPIFDRGLLFADAVYEGFGILDGQIVDFIYHMRRLEQSLSKIAIPITFTIDSMFQDMMALIEKNAVTNGFLYLHVTRGAGDRAFHYHDGYIPNIFAFTQGEKFVADDMPPAITLHAAPDLRWARRDIKSTNLLAQVMAKHAANEAGDYEALMIDQDGYVTEAGSSSFFYIKNGDLFVRPVSNEILHGITRQTMLRVAKQMDLRFVERVYKLDEVLEADEAFITASSIYVLPVSKIDDYVIADGQVGRFTLALREAYLETARAEFYKPTDI